MHQIESDILLQKQKGFFESGKTRNISFRLDVLTNLYKMIESNESKILDALKKDLNKSTTEAYTSEIGYVLKEIQIAIKQLKKWSKPQRVKTALINQPGSSFIHHIPYGTVLVISPWNYPFGLLFTPIVGALAAGNCVIAKPSEIAVNTSHLIYSMIKDNFHEEYFAVVEGDAEVTQSLINDKIDYIFFTGSTNVGKKIMKSASIFLLPVTLELGGKNPCIVDKEVNLEVSARRIVWGKFFNAGQTCVAPDYLVLHKDLKDSFLPILKSTIDEFYPDRDNFSHIINTKHFDRISALMVEGKIISGGIKDKENLYISPTVITDIDWNSKIIQEEVFGPLLPVIFYDNLDDVLFNCSKKSKPLCIYFFSDDKLQQEKVINQSISGSVCINGTIHTIMSHELPFGGVGASGMGNYHGKASFDTFSQKKSVMKKSFLFDQKFAYPPYKTTLNLLKKALKILN